MNTSPINASVHTSTEAWPALLTLATQEVFAIMVGAELTVVPGTSVDDSNDVTCMVGLAGDLCGVVTVRSAAPAVALMASKMLGCDLETDSPQTCDAFGELCNMIAGNFKHKIAGRSNYCMLSVPTVITGTGYRLHSLAEAGKISVNFLFEGHPLSVSLEVYS
jgi:chemotaxis protein CheX